MSIDERLDDILTETKQLCARINERKEILGDINASAFRNDPVIKKAQSRICSLYREAIEMCELTSETEYVCNRFMSQSECFQQLLLSEEFICPLKIEEEEYLSNWLYLVPFVLGIFGSLLVWFENKNRNPKKARSILIFGILWTFFILIPATTLIAMYLLGLL